MRRDEDYDIDPEGPSAEDLDRFGGDTVRCRECGEEVWDDSAICPRCGRALHEESRGGSRGLPTWAAIAGVIALLAFVLVIVL